MSSKLSVVFRRGISALCFAFSSAVYSPAQSYSVDSFTFAGGGGTSVGGSYRVSGVLGQPDAGRLAGGRYLLDSGCLSAAIAVPTPGAPSLSVARANDKVVFSWPASGHGFVLQETTTVALPGSWQNTPTLPVVTGTANVLSLPASPGLKFYRLIKP